MTRRECEIVGLLMQDGLTNVDLADRLVISRHTVHYHLATIMRKLDVPSRTALVNYAWRNGRLTDDGYWSPYNS